MLKLTIENLADKVNEILEAHFKEHPEAIIDARQSNILSTRRIRDYQSKGLIPKPYSTGEGKQKWFDQTHVDALVALRLLQHGGLSEQYITKELDKTSNIDEQAYTQSQYVADASSYFVPSGATLSAANASSVDPAPLDALQYLNSLKHQDKNNITAKIQGVVAGSSLIGSTSQSVARNIASNTKPYDNVSKSSSLGLSDSVINKSNLLGSSISQESNKFSNDELLKSLSNSQTIKSITYTEYCIDENLGIFLKLSSKNNPLTQKIISETVKNEINKLLNNPGDKND